MKFKEFKSAEQICEFVNKNKVKVVAIIELSGTLSYTYQLFYE